MKISVLQANLVEGLKIVKGVATGKYSLPVLSNVLLESDNGRLKLTTTDLELSIQVWVGARVEEDGAFTLPVKTFYELVNNLSPERVDLELNTTTSKIHLSSGGTKAQIPGISALEFPAIKGVENGVNITMTGEMLRDMVDEVSASAAKFDNRPVLTSIYTNFVENRITMASADGYRLTVRKDILEGEVESEQTILVPVRTLQTVAKLIGKGKKAQNSIVNISFDSLREIITFDLGDIVVTSNLMGGTFPEYERIVPKSSQTTTIVYRDYFLRACNKAMVFAKDSANVVHLIITPSIDSHIGTIMVNAKSNEMGEIENMLDASVTGVGFDGHFNVQYLIETLKSMVDDQVILETITFADPMVIRANGRADLYYVLMPCQIKE